MTHETKQDMKQGFEIAGSWLTRVLLGVCIYFLSQQMNKIDETTEQLQDLKSEVMVLKYRIDDLSRTVQRLTNN